MREVQAHQTYKLLNSKYNAIYLDYVILSTDMEYEGMNTHKKAVIEAFKILTNRRKANIEDDYEITVDTEKMNAKQVSMEEFLELPKDEYYDRRPKKKSRVYSIPVPLPYWFAFLEPPYGVPYLKSDFIEFNNILFPDKENCEVYRWNDEFSNYFDEGKEWWGTGLWTAYDKKTGIIVLIGASLTD